MARPLRLEYAGALYHVTSRGDRREAIYENDADREAFLSLLADQVCETFNWLCHAYCLMGNHYHLLIGNTRGKPQQGHASTQRDVHTELQSHPQPGGARVSGQVQGDTRWKSKATCWNLSAL